MPEIVSGQTAGAATLDAHVERLQPSPSLMERGEKLMSPAAVAKAAKVPGHRGQPHLNGSTVFRFITKPKWINGRPIRMEAVRAGDRWLTSVEALHRYFEALTSALLITPGTAPTPETPKQRMRAARAASAKADEIFGSTD